MFRKYLVLQLMIFGLYYVVAMEELDGLNLCESNETYTEHTEIDQIDVTKFNITLLQVCLKNFQSKCVQKMKNLIEMNAEHKTDKKLLLKSKCCNGYELTLNSNNCRPVCEIPCLWGTCVFPNVCRCNKNYGGPFCNYLIKCPLGKHGMDCIQTCQCQNNSTCDSSNGTCNCQPGYAGRFCEKPCSPGFYGMDCKNECECEDGAACDPVNGTCSSCPPGHAGRNCEPTCPSGFYGQQCESKCNCPYNAACDPVDGSCTCRKGFSGKYCLIMNKFHKFRLFVENSAKRCDCDWYETVCDPLTGECKCKHNREGVCYCKPGWTGHNCRTLCPTNTYGLNCTSTCKCHNGARCRPTDGVCICKKGFFGPVCSEVCPKNYYGNMCLHRCMCNDAEICDPIRGCICDNSRSNNSCITALKLEPENELSTWLYDISVILSLLIISTVLITGMFMCYFHLYHRKIRKRNRAIKNHFELHKSAILEESCNSHGSLSTISGMCDKYDNMRNHMFNLGGPMTYTNEAFIVEYDHVRFAGYESSENIYFEIDESTLKPTEDLYDHLDFLRPTGSWKPHYQSTGGNSTSNFEKNNAS